MTPSASNTSALPLLDVNDLFPCLAIRAPAAQATRAAAVEILKVVISPPPVPQVSISRSLLVTATGIMAFRSARTPPATSVGTTPFTFSATRKAAICVDDALSFTA